MKNMNIHPMKIISSKERYKINPGKIIEIFGNHNCPILLYPDIDKAVMNQPKYSAYSRRSIYRKSLANNFGSDCWVKKTISCLILSTHKLHTIFKIFYNGKIYYLNLYSSKYFRIIGDNHNGAEVALESISYED